MRGVLLGLARRTVAPPSRAGHEGVRGWRSTPGLSTLPLLSEFITYETVKALA